MVLFVYLVSVKDDYIRRMGSVKNVKVLYNILTSKISYIRAKKI